jgi:hypothetical protein
MAWLGLKTLAYVPLTRSNIPSDVPPPDWGDQIMARVYDDIDSKKTLVDRSLRAYIHTVSSGLADLHVVVQPPQTIVGTGAGGTDVPPDALEARLGNQLRAQGYDGAAIVMLGGPGGGSTTGYWSRFCMSDDHGVWVGEIVHQTNLCNLPDLFDFTDQYPDENMGAYDQEAGYGYTHFSVWTKRAIGWLNPSTVPLFGGHSANYTIHSASLIQPPPAGRVAAVQVGTQVPYLMIEARNQADQFDINIPNDGVIVYQVQTSDPLGNPQNSVPPLNLLTKKGLVAGQSFTAPNQVAVKIDSVVAGGFSITVTNNAMGTVPGVIGETEPTASASIKAAGFMPKFVAAKKPAPARGAVGAVKKIVVKKLVVESQTPVGGASAHLGTVVTCTMAANDP